MQAFKLVVYAALVLRARCAEVTASVTCKGRCGQSFISTGFDSHCHCDYWCNNRNDCCGGTESKDELCPNLRCAAATAATVNSQCFEQPKHGNTASEVSKSCN